MSHSNFTFARVATIVAVCLAFCSASAFAGEIRLAWDAVEGASGYRVYYGTSSGDYTRSVSVGNSTTGRLTGLENCKRYYMAVKAYNSAGESPTFSNELNGWAQPEIRRVDPDQGDQGDQFTMNIHGVNFEGMADLDWTRTVLPRDSQGNPLLHLESARVLSCSVVQLMVSIEPGARGFRATPLGNHLLQFELTNPDGVFGTGNAVLAVEFDRRRADINRSNSGTSNRVDGQDLAWLAYAYGAGDGAPRFNPDADLNGDGLVDGEDLALLSPGFGGCWTGSGWSASACP